ncbi:hypothetical protein ON010_g19062 [Phytophthora cinnamomi]|nr:hypothetical protein ON010_g19062 [Phytophthora cinnamomi]
MGARHAQARRGHRRRAQEAGAGQAVLRGGRAAGGGQPLARGGAAGALPREPAGLRRAAQEQHQARPGLPAQVPGHVRQDRRGPAGQQERILVRAAGRGRLLLRAGGADHRGGHPHARQERRAHGHGRPAAPAGQASWPRHASGHGRRRQARRQEAQRAGRGLPAH